MNESSREFYEALKEKLAKETGLGTEYSISPGDFESLLCEEKVKTMLLEWFGVSIKENNNQYSAISSNGLELDINNLYMQIELDPQKRFDIYQIGMSIWR